MYEIERQGALIQQAQSVVTQRNTDLRNQNIDLRIQMRLLQQQAQLAVGEIIWLRSQLGPDYYPHIILSTTLVFTDAPY